MSEPNTGDQAGVMVSARPDTVPTSQDPAPALDHTTRVDPQVGLTSAQVAERTAQGAVNTSETSTSRSVWEIVRANVFTRFNLLVGSLVVVILVIGPIQDAVFGLVMVVNSAIGIFQEVRTKRALDRLALVSAPRVAVMRDGSITTVASEDVVTDDLVRVGRGDQIVVDGVVVDSRGLEVDESLLTGESHPQAKTVGDECLSGSAVVAGAGVFRATRVGAQAYASQITREARRFGLVESELRAGTDLILRWVGWAIVPTAVILVWSQMRSAQSWTEAARGAVAGTVGMVPQGLVLLISVALAVGVARLARHQVLTQELAALEGLARVDVLCFDKTGTITQGLLTVREVIQLDDTEVGPALAALAHLDPDPNVTTRALLDAHPHPPGWEAVKSVPFSSDRRWSGATFRDRGTWILGAPDALGPLDDAATDLVRRRTNAGNRVLLLASSPEPLTTALPQERYPRAIVALGDVVRADAGDTVGFFAEQGVELKVISGDHPQTVAAVAREAGIRHGTVLSGADLPENEVELGEIAEQGTVFGRIGPEQKRALVRSLRRRGHVVAMVGDGVNDVLAIKAADVGIAIGSGSAAARAVAALTLVDGRFSRMPSIVAEGRRVIGNIERVASLYVTKTVYAFLLAWATGIAGWAFPLLPRHYTIIGAATIGIPSFWLALEPTRARARPGFVLRVMRFGVPVGAVTALAGFGAFWMANGEDVPLDDARAVTTLTLVAVGLAVLLMVARPLTSIRKLIVTVMGLGSAAVFLVPGLRDFYALSLPRPTVVLAATGIVALTAAAMYGALRASGWWRELPTALRELERLTSMAAADALPRGPEPGRDAPKKPTRLAESDPGRWGRHSEPRHRGS